MKKLVSIILLIFMLLGTLAGCGGTTTPPEEPPVAPPDDPQRPDDPSRPGDGGGSSLIDKIPDGMTGEDVAKLLLAGERLGDKIIDGESIFDNGVETFRHLAAVARENGRVTVAPTRHTFLDSERDGGRDVQVTAQGEVYTEFDVFSRNYEEFASTTQSIISEAESAARDIDYVKKHVRLLDVWVSGGWIEGVRFFLHVDESSETILTDMGDGFSVCRRYKNAEGDDVYETYRKASGGFAIRATYIKDKKYEFVHYIENGGTRYQGISASKAKGYWEIIDFISDESWIDDQFDVGFIVMKDDVCYRTQYDNILGKVSGYKLTTADRGCDIINVNEYENQVCFVLNLAAFTGYEKAIDNGGGISDLYLDDGRILNEDVRIENGKFEAWINGISTNTSAFGKEGSMMLNVVANNVGECREILLDLLDGWGLECKYDMRKVYDSVDRAAIESENAIKYITWNGHRINDNDGLLAAVEVEAERFASLASEYNSRKDLTEVNVSSESYEFLIKFAEAKATAVDVFYENGIITVSHVGVEIHDTILMVKDEPYHVALALESLADGSLIHLASEAEGTPYGAGDSFSVTAEGIVIRVPHLAEGSYRLVAYLATAEGIRSSGVSPVPTLRADAAVIKEGNLNIGGSIADGALVLTYEENVDVSISLRTERAVSYAEFYDIVAAEAYKYGEPEKVLVEAVGADGAATPLTGEESEIAEGSYRLAYSVENGERSISGYVYVDYSIKPAEPDLPAEPELPKEQAI